MSSEPGPPVPAAASEPWIIIKLVTLKVRKSRTGLNSRSELKWSLNRADYRHSSTLQDLDDSLIDPFINSLAVGSDLNSLVKESFDYIKRTFEFCIAIEDCLIQVGLEVRTDKKKFVGGTEEVQSSQKAFFEKLLVLKGTIYGQEESMLEDGVKCLVCCRFRFRVSFFCDGSCIDGCYNSGLKMVRWALEAERGKCERAEEVNYNVLCSTSK
ncbi:hypothetical protein GOBAR_AA15775 [Gossypium barbadense]|uniref:Uncharacterized protein n=1 Tax=Gossypium barbadense TaxID=3634 RepID=A0A2P5XNE1_GOSBA|nr:hypothetical protein GOBAR_AA15775 [Gossypium barbadense]